MKNVKDELSHEGKEHIYETDQVEWKGGYENHAEIEAVAYCIYSDCENAISLNIDIDFINKETKIIDTETNETKQYDRTVMHDMLHRWQDHWTDYPYHPKNNCKCICGKVCFDHSNIHY